MAARSSSASSSAPPPCGCAATTSPSSPSASERSSASPSTTSTALGPESPTAPTASRIPDLLVRIQLRRSHDIGGFSIAPLRQLLLPAHAAVTVIVAFLSSCGCSGLPHRPRLGRHPRGRDRRHRHGHQRLPRQAHRLRPRRHPRRPRRHRQRPRHLQVVHAVPSPAPSRPTPRSCSPPSSSAAWAPSAARSSAPPALPDPRETRAFSDYQLLAFGLALILIMRFRPEGIIPNRRRQLEFHDDRPGRRHRRQLRGPSAPRG